MARPIGIKGSDTANKIRNCSLHLFAQLGYAAVSMRMIAEAVGVQAAALYNHFPTKQDILCDLLQVHMQDLIDAWEREREKDESPSAALLRFTRFHIRYHIQRPDEVFISYMELRNLEPENFSAIENMRGRYEGYLRDILSAGQTSGSFSIADAPVTSMAVISMLTGVNTWYRSGGRLDVEDIEEIYEGLVSRCVGLDHSSTVAPEPNKIEDPV
ncbi:MAG: TetR/AcrR family transcriptional regulator [Stappiaceae bacterium]